MNAIALLECPCFEICEWLALIFLVILSHFFGCQRSSKVNYKFETIWLTNLVKFVSKLTNLMVAHKSYDIVNSYRNFFSKKFHASFTSGHLWSELCQKSWSLTILKCQHGHPNLWLPNLKVMLKEMIKRLTNLKSVSCKFQKYGRLTKISNMCILRYSHMK